MTAPDLCRLASAAFPGVTFEPLDLGHGIIRAQSSSVRVRRHPKVVGFMVTVPGGQADYTGTGDTIEAAYADALACRAEHEPAPAPLPTVQGTLDL